MLRSRLCDYSEEIFKDFAPFTDCISEMNNTQKDNAKYDKNIRKHKKSRQEFRLKNIDEA